MENAHEATVEIGDRQYVLASDDDYLDQLGPVFESDMVRLFRTLVNPSDVVLDVGANIGCTCLLLSQLARQVYVFEPAPSTFRFLKDNIERSGAANIVLLNVGLGAEPSRLPLTYAPSNRAGGYVSDHTNASSGHRSEEIEVRTLDAVMSESAIPSVDFIKIDTEGFEPHVLRGASQTLAAFKPTVVIELNHWCLNAFQRTSVPDFFDQLLATFPIVLGVHGEGYLDLRDEGERYSVMYHHICRGKFLNLVASFDEARLSRFKCLYRHGLFER
jgi:FkbM family methyltransferase